MGMGRLLLSMSTIVLLVLLLPRLQLVNGSEVTSQKYKMLYGGVVGQEVPNVAVTEPDVAKAIEIALHTSGLAGHQTVTKFIQKQRLLYSSNGTDPFVFLQKTLSSGKMLVQKRQIALGTLYRFLIIKNDTCYGSDSCCSCGYQFDISQDKNKDYHVFRRTTISDTELMKSSVLHQATMGRCNAIDFLKCQLVLDKFGHTYSNKLSLVHDVISSEPVAASQWESSAQDYPQYFSGNLFPKDSSADPGSILRVATYNIWNVNGLADVERYEDRLQRLGKLLSSQMFDIYGFQEVRLQVGSLSATKSNPAMQHTQSQVSQLSNILPDHQFVYQPAMLHMESSQSRNEEGLAIFSRYPIVSHDYIFLPRNMTDDVDKHQRICLHAEIVTPLTKVHVFVTHLSLSQRSRERSVVEIWKYMEQYSGVKILMGDLNAESDSGIVRFLSDQETLGGLRATGWKDLWTTIGSNRNLTGYTFNACEAEPIKRIDYLFMGQPTPPVVNVLSTHIFGNQRECFAPCSDHYGLVTSLTLAH